MKTQSFSQWKKEYRKKVKHLLEATDFVVRDVRISVDYKASPTVGYNVTLQGKETPELRKKAEDTLCNYGYSIKFVK